MRLIALLLGLTIATAAAAVESDPSKPQRRHPYVTGPGCTSLQAMEHLVVQNLKLKRIAQSIEVTNRFYEKKKEVCGFAVGALVLEHRHVSSFAPKDGKQWRFYEIKVADEGVRYVAVEMAYDNQVSPFETGTED